MVTNSREEATWANVAFRIAVGAVSHPIEYAKVLIQIGHEPIAPEPTRTLFGKPALALPNIFQYVCHIKRVDGYVGCYRGLGPKLCANAISGIAFQKVTDNFNFGLEEEKPEEEETQTEDEKRDRFVRRLLRDLTGRAAAILVSQPFHVIAVRMMAQFVGREAKYNGIITSVGEIYNENGLSGFFSGLVPRFLGDSIAFVLASTLTYAVNTYFVEDRELRTYTSASMSFIASAVTYPLQVVSNCMAVTDSGLAAGMPPHMPVYVSWVDCWSHLSRTNQLKRGSSLLWRYYTGPQVVINNQAVIVTEGFRGQSTLKKY